MVKITFRSLLPGLSWALLILVLTGLPGDYFPKIRSFQEWLEPDKVIHLFLFGIFSFLILWGQRKHWSGRSQRRKILAFGLLIGVLYSGFTELLQDVVFVGRDGNIFDFGSDIIGVLIGMLLFWLIFRKKMA